MSDDLARWLERKAFLAELRQEALDQLVLGWLEAGEFSAKAIPWHAVPQTRAAREASERGH